MSRETITITTQDGDGAATVFRPDDGKAYPAVIFFMDALGIRPAILDMGERLANYGYVVLMPDLFYRYGPYDVMDPKAVFASGDVRGALGRRSAGRRPGGGWTAGWDVERTQGRRGGSGCGRRTDWEL